jgi:hypothetical protein
MSKQVVRPTHHGCATRILPLLTAVLFLLVAVAQAQDFTGGIGGTVRDPAGALVPGATVVAVSTAQGLRRSVVSNAKGQFELPQLPIGTYNVTITAPTFRTYEDLNVQVDPTVVTNIDASLTLGSVDTTVTVTSPDAGIDAQSASIGTLIDNTSVQEIPIDGNDIVGLAALLPGVTSISAPANNTADRSGPTYSASGSRTTQNLYLFDGIIYNNLFRNTGNTYPPREAIQEIQVLINNYGADYGRNAGSIFAAVTKSGTNVYHGIIWETAKNTAFNADNYLSGKLSNKLIQNQFGATFGGPILKDKLFFYATYQGYRYRANGSDSAKVFNSSQFSNATTNSIFSSTIYDPKTGLPFPGNTIPYQSFDQTAVNMITTFGLTTSGGSITTVAPTPNNSDLGMLRVDYIRGRNTYDARYYQLDPNSTAGSGNLFSYNTQNLFSPSILGEGTATSVLTPNILNVARAGYRRSVEIETTNDTRTLSSFGANFPVFGAPTLPYITLSSQFTLSNSSNAPANLVNENVELNDSVTWSRGNHNFKFGGNYLRLQYENLTNANTQGDFSFTGVETSITVNGKITGGSSLADFLLGLPATLTVASPTLNQSGIQHEFFFYAQDQWRARANLTVDIGLRYELPFNWYNPKNHWGTFRQGVQSQAISNAPVGLLFPGDPGVSRGIVSTDANNFGPRMGFSWDPFKKGTFVVRGGAGVFFDAFNADIIQNQTQPYQYDFTYSNVYSFSNPLYGQTPIPTTINLNNPLFVGLPSITFPDPNLRSPYVMQFNFGYQQQLPGRIFYEADYVGRFSRKLFIPYTFNPSLYAPGASTANTDSRRIIQGFGVINDLASIGTANYNAVQVKLTRRMHNLTLNGSYTYSKSLDTGSVADTESGYLPHAFSIGQDYGLSDFDVRHAFTLAWIMNLPTLQGHEFLLREVFGGWSYTGIYNAHTGQPLNVTLGLDSALSTMPNQRPNQSGNPNLPSNRSRRAKIAQYYDTSVFSIPQAGTYGNTKRNIVNGPPQIINNMALSKSFHVPAPREGVVLQYRCEALGTFNTPNLKPPSGSTNQTPQSGSGSYGYITNTTGERQLQMSIRLVF